jgi:hypothetical protein
MTILLISRRGRPLAAVATLLFGLLLLLSSNSAVNAFTHQHSSAHHRSLSEQQQRRRLPVLFAEPKKSGKAEGVYVRPSGAIERGSGFFVPGLEGPKVRLVVGGVLLSLTAINHMLAGGGGDQQPLALEESIAIVYSFLVLLSSAIEFGKEELIVEGNSSKSNINNTPSGDQQDFAQQWTTTSKTLKEDYKFRVQWAAASYMAVTPATQMLLLEQDNLIVYRLGGGGGGGGEVSSKTAANGIQAALDQLRQSKGGRIALPATHPAVVALGLSEARTVVLQQITDNSCWMMSSSDQLLASFTLTDLKWLGQLATYVNI